MNLPSFFPRSISKISANLYLRLSAQIFGIFVLLLLITTNRASAIELYSIVYPDCKTGTGLIIGVEDEKLHLLSLEGVHSAFPRKDIEHILVYNTLDNPFSQLDLSYPLMDFAKEVTVQGEETINFIGWPIRFMENLIVFFDIEGKTHLVDVELIQGFNQPDLVTTEIKNIEQFKKYNFGFGNNLPGCKSKSSESDNFVQPTRMISDQIKISKLLLVYQKGFTKLDRFQKRTYFYARPYLYEKKTKVGIVVGREDYQEELPQLLPLNFQWPTGSNFGPQGILNLGMNVNEYLPNVEPVFGLRFSGKYHFLSLTFAGNPWAFSYGSDFIVSSRANFSDFFARRNPEDTMVFPQYNQLALTGFEWGNFGISGGYYYPIIAIQGNGIFRELLSEQSMPFAAFTYTTEDTRIQLMASDMRLQSNNPSDLNIKMINAEEMSQGTVLTESSKNLVPNTDNFDLQSRFLRFNFDWDLDDEVRIGLSEVIFWGSYEETVNTQDYKLDFNQLITSAKLQQEFGEYVALKLYLNYFIRQYHSQAVDHDKKPEDNKASFAVVVEFIL